MKRNYNNIGIYSQSSGKVAKGAIDTTLQDALSGHRTNVLHINSTPGDMQSWFKHIKEIIQNSRNYFGLKKDHEQQMWFSVSSSKSCGRCPTF